MRTLDFRALDEATLIELIEAFRPLAGPTDPFAGFVLARAAYVLAEKLRNQGDFAGALALVEEGLVGAPDPGGMRPHLLHLQADLVMYSRDFERALALLDEARAALTDDQQRSGVAASILALRGEVHLGLGLPDQAAPWILEALDLALELRLEGRLDKGALLDALTKRANLRMATESYDLLLEELEDVLADEELLAGRSTARARLLARLGIAHLWFARGPDVDAGEARRLLSEALAEPGLLALDRLTCHARLAQLELWCGDLERAAAELEAARGLLATMAADPAFRFPPIELAFVAALDARLARLAHPEDVATLRARRDALTSAFDALVLGWRDRPSRGGGVGLLRYARTQLVLGELVEAELAVEPGRAGFDRILADLARAQAVGALAEALDAHASEPEAVRELLVPEGGGLLVYVPAPFATHVLAVDAAGELHARLDDARDLRAACDELDLLVRRSPDELASDAARERRRADLAGRGRALADALWPAGIGARLGGWRSVNLVASDLVGNLPLEALPLADGRCLGAALAVSNLPGLPVGVALARRSPYPPAEQTYELDLVLVTQVRPGARVLERFDWLGELPVDDDWVRAWTRPFAPDRVATLLGPGATLAALREATARPARLLQIVTHGVRDAGEEQPAGLLLAEDGQRDGLAWFEDVARLDAPPLVVLSACGAGRGPERRGDAGATTLGGAFLIAGADAVVLAAADTAFRPTALLDERLHAELARGSSPAEALRAARAQLIEHDGFEDPFHHAQMRVFGLGRQPLFPPRDPAPRPDAPWQPSKHLVAAAVALGLCAAALLALRAKRTSAFVRPD